MFNRLFRYFDYPFDKADEEFEKLSETEQFKYLQDIYEWTESKSYKIESQEIIRTIYRDMANKAQNNIEFTGYRLALILFKRYDQRLLFLKSKYNSEKSHIELNESLNE